MQYKNILVYLDQGTSNAERVNTAVALAKAHSAQLTGIVAHALPTSRMMQKLGLATSDDVLLKTRQEAAGAVDAFNQRMQNEDIAFDSLVMESKESHVPEKLARFVRNYDVCIMRQANPDKPNADFITDLSECVLFSSGRPVIYIPYIGVHHIPCRTGMIAWDGSAAASRAVHDALPLLTQMKEVVILVVDADRMKRNTDALPGDALSQHLTAHGVNTRVSRVSSGETNTSTIILNEVSDNGIDLLVMGGYGTAKLREMILGGVTRTLFETMTVPVFMSH